MDDPQINRLADEMGITLYQRLSLAESAVLLGCTEEALQQICDQRQIEHLRIGDQIQFFGHQVLAYLLECVQLITYKPQSPRKTDRILRITEVRRMTGLSRTTIWRMEKENQFPARVALGIGSVGWKMHDIQHWLDSRETL